MLVHSILQSLVAPYFSSEHDELNGNRFLSSCGRCDGTTLGTVMFNRRIVVKGHQQWKLIRFDPCTSLFLRQEIRGEHASSLSMNHTATADWKSDGSASGTVPKPLRLVGRCLTVGHADEILRTRSFFKAYTTTGNSRIVALRWNLLGEQLSLNRGMVPGHQQSEVASSNPSKSQPVGSPF